MFIVDAHCDTLLGMYSFDMEFGKNKLQVDYSRLEKFKKDGYLQFFAIFESPSRPIPQQKKEVEIMIDLFNGIIKDYPLKPIYRASDIEVGKMMALLSVEGLYFLEGDVDKLNDLYNKGVRCVNITWNPDNEFSGGILGESQKGLSKKGFELVERAFDLGVLLDVSHITDKGFWDLKERADIRKKPFIASHSNARKLCSHMRNLNDNMIKGLAESGGVMGLNVYSCFLNDNCKADVNDLVKHAEYVCALVGAEHLGIGADFDGIGDWEKSAIKHPEEFNIFLEKLLQLNYKEEDVKKIAGGNFVRVLKQILPE